MNTTELAWKQYMRLEDEFISITDYVHLSKEHLDVYSYQLMNLLIAVGVEFDTISSTLLNMWLEKSGVYENKLAERLNGKKSKGDFFTMKDYREAFECKFAASTQSVTVVALGEEIFPFAPADIKESLGWWKAFTSLKHDRIENFVRAATMGHVLHGLAALLFVNRYLASAKEEFPPYKASSLFEPDALFFCGK